MLQASKKVKGRGNRRYRPEDGGPAEAEAAMGTINGMDRQHDEHRSKHKHHRQHRHRPRDRDGNVIEPGGSGHMSPDRCATSLALAGLFEQTRCDRRTTCYSSCTVYLGFSFAAALCTMHNYSWNQP